jgi:hypothetical protein
MKTKKKIKFKSWKFSLKTNHLYEWRVDFMAQRYRYNFKCNLLLKLTISYFNPNPSQFKDSPSFSWVFVPFGFPSAQVNPHQHHLLTTVSSQPAFGHRWSMLFTFLSRRCHLMSPPSLSCAALSLLHERHLSVNSLLFPLADRTVTPEQCPRPSPWPS